MVSHTFFTLKTAEFFRFYKNKMLFPNAEPNACHLALSQLEKEGNLSAVLTQNIDGLHQKAGSKKVFELHGSVWRNYCLKCKKPHTMYEVIAKNGVPTCDCGGVIKPDVVLYEEPLDNAVWAGALGAVRKANTLIVGGTSLVVYPAANLIREFNGEHIVVINRTPTSADELAEVLFSEDIGKVFTDVMQGW